MEERRCLECGEILKGRSDQKFCGDQCRSAYNNRRFGDVGSYIKRVDRTLKKNRTILTQLNPGGKTTLPKTELGKHGFDFAYHTHTYTTRDGRTYFFCYEQGFLELDNEKVLLVRKEE